MTNCFDNKLVGFYNYRGFFGDIAIPLLRSSSNLNWTCRLQTILSLFDLNKFCDSIRY